MVNKEEFKQNLQEKSKNIVIFLSVLLILNLLVFAGYILYYSQSNNYIIDFTLIQLEINIAVLIVGLIFGILLLNTIIGVLILGFSVYYSGDLMFSLIERETSYTLAYAYWLVLIIIGIIALLILIFGLLHRFLKFMELLIARDSAKRNSFLNNAIEFIKKEKLKVLLLFIVGVPLLTTNLLYDNGMIAPKIIIQPKDYQIEFRLWSYYRPSDFLKRAHGTEILDQMNKHGVIIQNAWFPVRDEDGVLQSFSPTIYPEDNYTIVSNLTWFKNNYPNIRFQYYAAGVGLGSNGNYEGSIYTAPILKRFVDIARQNNLSNVVGVYTDWEGPSRSAPRYSNETLNGWHQALWTDAMAYAKAYFPDWIFSNCHPREVDWDFYDPDPDLQYYTRYNIFMPMWTDYGPMVYRNCDCSKIANSSSGGSYYIYSSAKALVDGALKGDYTKASFWLGCTGSGPYQNTTQVIEHGEPLDFGEGKGFDLFARDILILKSFRIPSISIFHAIDTYEVNAIITGFFDQYGYTDALDKLNETVNGVNSTKPFYIYADGSWNMLDILIKDFQLNFDSIYYLPVIFAIYYAAYMIDDKVVKKKSRKQDD